MQTAELSADRGLGEARRARSTEAAARGKAGGGERVVPWVDAALAAPQGAPGAPGAVPRAKPRAQLTANRASRSKSGEGSKSMRAALSMLRSELRRFEDQGGGAPGARGRGHELGAEPKRDGVLGC